MLTPIIFAWMDAAATIIFRPGKMWLLFKGSYSSRAAIYSVNIASQVDEPFCFSQWSRVHLTADVRTAAPVPDTPLWVTIALEASVQGKQMMVLWECTTWPCHSCPGSVYGLKVKWNPPQRHCVLLCSNKYVATVAWDLPAWLAWVKCLAYSSRLTVA